MLEYVKEVLKRDFTGYKKEFVASTNIGEDFKYNRKQKLHTLKIFGIPVKHVNAFFEESGKLEFHTRVFQDRAYKKTNIYEIWVLVIESNKKVFWTHRKMPDEWNS